MKISVLKYLLFIIIPAVSVLFCLIFELAQGEKIEEIIFGIMSGFVLDLIYLIILLLMNKKSARNKTN